MRSILQARARIADMVRDFERSWLSKFSVCIEREAGPKIRDRIMEGSESLSDSTGRDKIVEWSTRAMTLLDEHVQEDKRVEIMTGCACKHPKAELQEIRKKYEETKDIDLVLKMLQEKFVSFLSDGLNLDTDTIDVIVQKGWGLAGRRDGSRIIATKIPKSAYILEYLREKNPTRKRAIYCHCPRIREALKHGVEISPTYCYCGAGFYKGIWEEIMQKQVMVGVLKSVLKGDDVCSIAIHLPLEKR